MGKLSNLRSGKPLSKVITVGGIEMAVVVLPSDIIREIEESTAKYMSGVEGGNPAIKNLYFDTLLCYHCMRDPEDESLQAKMADNIEEVKNTLDVEDISRVTQAYSELMMNKYEGLELMTLEKLDEVKKYLEQTKLSDLSTVSQVHLANFHHQIVSEK